MKPEMQSLFSQESNIPQIPEVVRLLIIQANDPNIDFKSIASNVEKEQVISVKVLRMVNSAHYGFSNKVSSIHQALTILGINELKKLIVVSAFVKSIDEIPGIDLNDFWIDNFRTASYAKWLADHTRFSDSSMVFTAGLISSIGKMLIHLDDATTAKKINLDIKNGGKRPDAERKHLGFTHQEVSAELCKTWQFPNDLIDTIIQSSEPLAFDKASLAASAVYIARYVSESSHSNKDQQTILAEFPYQEWQSLGLKEEAIAEKIALLLALDTGLEGLLD